MRKTDIRINIVLASLPGLCGFLNGPWMQVHGGCITGLDVAAWPQSVGMLCKCAAFLGSVHWPVGAVDMVHYDISFRKFLSFLSNGWSQFAQ